MNKIFNHVSVILVLVVLMVSAFSYVTTVKAADMLVCLGSVDECGDPIPLPPDQSSPEEPPQSDPISNPVNPGNTKHSLDKETNNSFDGVTIPVTGNGFHSVTCGLESRFRLQNGDMVTLPSTDCSLKVSMQQEYLKTLPSALPNGYNFVDGFSVAVVSNGQGVTELPGTTKMNLQFARNPVGVDRSKWVILHWNEETNTWDEISSENLSASSSLTGLFVLATK